MALSATVFAENKLSVKEDMSNGTIVVSMNNTDQIRTITFDLILPAGVVPMDEPTPQYSTTKFPTAFNYDEVSNTLNITVQNTQNTMTKKPNLFSEGETILYSLPVEFPASYQVGSVYFANGSATVAEADAQIKFAIGKVGKKGYSSFSGVDAYKIEGATPYYGVISEDAQTIVLKEFDDAVVLPFTGAVLKGTEGTTIYATNVIDLAPGLTVKSDFKATSRVANDRFGFTVEPKTVHVLSTVDNVPGFYLYDGTYLLGNKAYIDKGQDLAPVRMVFDDEVNGISEVNDEESQTVIFNLQGQKVNEVKKGIHIVNGKKVMF